MSQIATNSFFVDQSLKIKKKNYWNLIWLSRLKSYTLFIEAGLVYSPGNIHFRGAPALDHSFVFTSQDVYSNKKLLVLIHGAGDVRAGQWARYIMYWRNLICFSRFSYCDCYYHLVYVSDSQPYVINLTLPLWKYFSQTVKK
jgi:hypothetical protein